MDFTYFTQLDFYQALQRFFEQINIPINYLTEAPAAPEILLAKTYNSNNPAHRLMQTCYFLGMVDDAVFQQRSSGISAEDLKTRDYDGLLIFGVIFKPKDNQRLPSRTELAEITRALNREFHYTPVVVVFHYAEHYVSFANCERLPYKQTWREGEKAGKVSILKDIDVLRPHTGHLKILENLKIQRSGKQAINTFAALYAYWQQVLSVSLLNKRFYQELSNWYFWAVQQVEFPDDAEPDRDVRNATNVIRLLTRLMFVWFLKEKQVIPDALFDKTLLDEYLKYNDATGSTYYKAILQNLFFATLNTEMAKDNPHSRKFVHRQYGVQGFYRYSRLFHDPDKALDLFRDIPFLNGGLFENLDKQVGTPQEVRIDCFSDRRDNEARLKVPDRLFFGEEAEIDLSQIYGDARRRHEKVKGLIPLLKSYKFTIAENTLVEEEIALDPELLGKVFENLLASYNPETRTTARKQTGSFYTPREIVNYMVDESVIAYLMNSGAQASLSDRPQCPASQSDGHDGHDGHSGSGGWEDKLRRLLSYSEEPHGFSDEEVRQLIQAINRCKILDPACGSGAFPMGILHKMVHVLSKLDPENARWKAQQIETQTRSIKEDIAYAEQIRDDRARQKALDELHDKLAAIHEAFDENELDYSRKLYLIENGIYGVDIQPIAVQIAKLRFFISLIVDQKVNPGKANLGILPLPNLETKFVAANTLIGIEKPAQMTLRNPQIDKKEAELKQVRQRHFDARTPATKDKYRREDERLRRELADLLQKDGFPANVTEQLAHWNPYDQNASAGFFDSEWMFGIQEGFDIVIGNPPYVDIKQLPNKTVRTLFQLFSTTHNRINLYSIFIEKSCKLLNKTGILVFINPNSILLNSSYLKIRKFIVKDVAKIIKLPDNVFENTVVETIILVLNKSSKSDLVLGAYYKKDQNIDFDNLLFHRFKKGLWQEDNYCKFNIFVSPKIISVLERIDNQSSQLSKFTDFSLGITPYDRYKGHSQDLIKGRGFHSPVKLDDSYVPLITGQNIVRYCVMETVNEFLKYGEWLGAPRQKRFFTEPRIIIRQIVSGNPPRIYAGYTEKELYHTQIGFAILKKKESQLELKYLLAILNSTLLNFYHTYRYLDVEKDTFQKILIENCKLFPIKVASQKSQESLIAHVDRIIAAKQQNPAADTRALEAELDRQVYALYGLTYDEVQIIDPNFALSAEEYQQVIVS